MRGLACIVKACETSALSLRTGLREKRGVMTVSASDGVENLQTEHLKRILVESILVGIVLWTSNPPST
jgi:hypothetical protein